MAWKSPPITARRCACATSSCRPRASPTAACRARGTPAAAAQQLIDAYGLEVPADQIATLRLRDLIQQTARFPDGSLPGQGNARRRGRRRPN